jgi:hypothetical protein
MLELAGSATFSTNAAHEISCCVVEAELVCAGVRNDDAAVRQTQAALYSEELTAGIGDGAADIETRFGRYAPVTPRRPAHLGIHDNRYTRAIGEGCPQGGLSTPARSAKSHDNEAKAQ